MRSGLVEASIPDRRRPVIGIEIIPFSSAHAWVEVYFPGFGWAMFDPTAATCRSRRRARSAAAPSRYTRRQSMAWPRRLPTMQKSSRSSSPASTNGGRRCDRRDARVPIGSSSSYPVSSTRPRREICWPDARPRRTGRVRAARRHPGRVGDPVDPTMNPPLFGGDQIASATMAADQNGAAAFDLILKPDGHAFADYAAATSGPLRDHHRRGRSVSRRSSRTRSRTATSLISGGDRTVVDPSHAHGLRRADRRFRASCRCRSI